MKVLTTSICNGGENETSLEKNRQTHDDDDRCQEQSRSHGHRTRPRGHDTHTEGPEHSEADVLYGQG